MTGKFPIGATIKYLVFGILICLGEITLQRYRLNGFLLLGALLAFYAINLNRPNQWGFIVFSHWFSLYVLFQYQFIPSLILALLILGAAIMTRWLTNIMPHSLRFWLLIAAGILSCNIGIYAAVRAGAVSFYSPIFGGLTGLITIAAGVIFRPLADSK